MMTNKENRLPKCEQRMKGIMRLNEFTLHKIAAFGFAILITIIGGAGAVLALQGQPDESWGWGPRGFSIFLAFLFGGTGLVVLHRRPANLVAWLFLSLALVSAVQGLLFEFGILTLIRKPGSLPGGLFTAWVLNWLWVLIFPLLSLSLIYFPDGKLPGRSWRYVVGWILFVMGVSFLLFAFQPGPMESSFPTLDNPYGFEPLRGFSSSVFFILFFVILLSVLGAAVAAIITRFLRSKGIVRQQMKWFAFAGLLVAATSVFAPTNNVVLQSIFITAIAFLPIAMGIAIIRYRLYDIDIIIRRTLQYLIVTVTLALVYFGSVILLQGLLTSLTGQPSPLAVVLSTLAIAGLFNPLRIRVQRAIDRRFYRKQYNSTQVLETFSNSIRDEVDLENVEANLIRAVSETMQPDHVSLWLCQEQSHNLKNQSYS
jgi:hypothetical protein